MAVKIVREEIRERIERIRRNEVPEGYKYTEIGIIPRNWKLYLLREIIKKIETGASVNSDNTIEADNYILKTSAIKNGKFYPQESKGVIQSEVHRLRCPVVEGSIIVSRMNTPQLVGETGYIDKSLNNIYLPDRLWQLYNGLPDICDFKWLNYLLASNQYRCILHKRATGTSNSMKNISKDEFLSITIPLPAKKEQGKIVEVLSVMDKAIQCIEEIIKEKEKQKKYLFQNLLTGKKRLNDCDGEWRVVKLGELFQERVEINCENEELLAITGFGIIPRYEIDAKDNSSEDKSKYKKIYVGDIGYNTMRMWQGVSAYSDYEGIVSPAYTILKPSDNIYAKFFAYLFKLPFCINLFYRYSQGLVNDTLNLKYSNFKKIKVNIPIDKEEQKAIARILESADKEIVLLEQQLQNYKREKQSIMQLLLTGIVRVTELDRI